MASLLLQYSFKQKPLLPEDQWELKQSVVQHYHHPIYFRWNQKSWYHQKNISSSRYAQSKAIEKNTVGNQICFGKDGKIIFWMTKSMQYEVSKWDSVVPPMRGNELLTPIIKLVLLFEKIPQWRVNYWIFLRGLDELAILFKKPMDINIF